MAEQFVYGMHAVSALLTHMTRPVKKLIINNERQDEPMQALLAKAKRLGIPIEPMNMKRMNERFKEMVHQGVVALTQSLPDYQERDLKTLLSECKSEPFILILDGVTDPHNLGACLRSADAAGVDFVVIPRDKSASITPVVSKIACGAAETMPLVRVTNLVRALELLKEQGVWIYGAAGEATKSMYELDCKRAIALILGAEGQGLRRLTREHCDELYSIPMNGTVESLNVSVATGISLYEVVRQRY